MTKMKKIYNFYDTSSLLLRANTLFENEDEQIIISSITLQELEDIKTKNNKSPDIKCAARRLLATLDEADGAYEIVIFTLDMLEPITQKSLMPSDDMKILASAIWCNNNLHVDETNFITNDLCLKKIANLFFGNDSIDSVPEDIDDEYTGYIEATMDEETMANFYTNLDYNFYNLFINEYLIIHNEAGEIVDKLKWNGETHEAIAFANFDSRYFGKVKPYKDDAYQAILADSFIKNKITLVKGPAGSGKTFLSLAYLLHKLERNQIDKIIIFCNTVAAKNSAKLGYYPGTRDEKLLDSQIGNLLSSKLGDKFGVEQMILSGQLVLLPMSDIRGYDTSGMKAGIYISEAQNLDISLMKLALQRIGEDGICIIDGDSKAQVDDISFEGHNNGMKRVSKVFRGSDIYGEVELNKIHRSRIAQIAEKL